MFGMLQVVDNRVFLLGLDDFYRSAIKRHERGELLTCARRVADVLGVSPARVPVEGYYAEEQRLTEYFFLLRALQGVNRSAAASVDRRPAFRRLLDVASAPLYGRPQFADRLLPTGRDALSQALLDTSPSWTMAILTKAAAKAARDTDDYSLVGLAGRVQDAVVLAALRESVVLYAEVVIGGPPPPRPRSRYAWRVDEDLVQKARRFIEAFKALFGEELPPPDAAQAEPYWHACQRNKILGRCVRLGWDDSTSPVRHYHWAIYRSTMGKLMVEEFWKPEIWTTERYSAAPGSQRGRARL